MVGVTGLEIQGKRLPISRLASNSHSITQLELPSSRLSPVFPLSVHGVVPNPYQAATVFQSGAKIHISACESDVSRILQNLHHSRPTIHLGNTAAQVC